MNFGYMIIDFKHCKFKPFTIPKCETQGCNQKVTKMEPLCHDVNIAIEPSKFELQTKFNLIVAIKDYK